VPERARGLNIDNLWADELACWQRAESTWDLAMLALRAGTDPRALITTTPRRLAVLRRIFDEGTTVQTSDSTYANQAHLPREFIAQIVGLDLMDALRGGIRDALPAGFASAAKLSRVHASGIL
jgi:phage terminase large subunit-like protein